MDAMAGAVASVDATMVGARRSTLGGVSCMGGSTGASAGVNGSTEGGALGHAGASEATSSDAAGAWVGHGRTGRGATTVRPRNTDSDKVQVACATLAMSDHATPLGGRWLILAIKRTD